ncbi:MAG: RimK family alpha-L-glutamate ligase, partial [Shewanella oncorhynchi]
MRGWILYKETATQLKPEWYEIERLLAAAKADNIELEVYAPDEFDLTVTREDNKS